MDDLTVSTLPKDTCESVAVMLRTWKGHRFVALRHREKFGIWPATRFASPVDPRPETRSWMRSRMIRFANAVEKARVA